MELRSRIFASSVVGLVALLSSCGGSAPGGSGSGATVTCSEPSTACGSLCVDLQNDPTNCGDCAHACAAPNTAHALCVAGTCAYDACSAGFADCDSDASNGCEVATDADVMNCGACGKVCAPDNAAAATCKNGACGHGSCAAGFADCDGDVTNGCETSILDDDANCGGCGNRCTVGSTCAAGVCGLVCDPPLDKCGSGATAFCTLTDDDPDNCGACGHSCTPMHVGEKACAHGVCGYGQCEAGWGDCDGDPTNGCETCTICDLVNCGGCGVACLQVHVQTLACNGTCVAGPCDAGWGDCDGNHDNGCEARLTDDKTCGASCTDCTMTNQHCVGGACS